MNLTEFYTYLKDVFVDTGIIEGAFSISNKVTDSTHIFYIKDKYHKFTFEYLYSSKFITLSILPLTGDNLQPYFVFFSHDVSFYEDYDFLDPYIKIVSEHVHREPILSINEVSNIDLEFLYSELIYSFWRSNVVTAIIGERSSGRSFFCNTIISKLLSENGNVLLIGNENTYKKYFPYSPPNLYYLRESNLSTSDCVSISSFIEEKNIDLVYIHNIPNSQSDSIPQDLYDLSNLFGVSLLYSLTIPDEMKMFKTLPTSYVEDNKFLSDIINNSDNCFYLEKEGKLKYINILKSFSSNIKSSRSAFSPNI